MKEKNALGARERLDKVLANHGYGTRKEVKRIIHSGAVLVNGEEITDDSFHVNLAEDSISIDGERLDTKLNAYIMLNKPAGYVCTTKEGERPTVFSLLDEEVMHKYLGGELQLVGRLDVDTEGLLLITSDGELNHRITSPQHHVPKTYFVRLESPITSAEKKEDYIKQLAKGMHIEAEGHEPEADCLPADLVWKKDDECEITVYEGKFHEVKRLFAALGNEVIYLKRLRVNQLYLDENLIPGDWRELTQEELKLIQVE